MSGKHSKKQKTDNRPRPECVKSPKREKIFKTWKCVAFVVSGGVLGLISINTRSSLELQSLNRASVTLLGTSAKIVDDMQKLSSNGEERQAEILNNSLVVLRHIEKDIQLMKAPYDVRLAGARLCHWMRIHSAVEDEIIQKDAQRLACAEALVREANANFQVVRFDKGNGDLAIRLPAECMRSIDKDTKYWGPAPSVMGVR